MGKLHVYVSLAVLCATSGSGCRPDEFQCVSSGYCQPSYYRCDGYNDCSDGSDEENCHESSEISVDNPYMDHYPDALWGVEEDCLTGHAFAFDMKYEKPGAVDQTSVNAVKLYCRDDSNGALTGQITSFEGRYGDYMGLRSCPEDDDKMTGFRLQVWPYQGTFGDDWAIDNVQISCNGNYTLDGMGNNDFEEEMNNDVRKFPAKSLSEKVEELTISIKSESLIHGEWTEWAYCSDGYYVSGLKTMVGEGHPFSDDTGLTDMYLYCSTV